MTVFSHEQTRAIIDIRTLWLNERIVLIGGMALDHAQALGHRRTEDLDLAVAIATERIASELLQLGGWVRDPAALHRWQSPLGVTVDILPIGPSVLTSGRIIWPDGSSMSALGFRHLLTQSTGVAIHDGLHIEVATPALIAFLKMVSFQERPADRSRDLGDLAHLLERPVDQALLLRESVVRAGLPRDQVGAFLLGCDLRGYLDPRELNLALGFVERVLGVDDGGLTGVRMTRVAPVSWRQDPDRIRYMMRALRRGLTEGLPT